MIDVNLKITEMPEDDFRSEFKNMIRNLSMNLNSNMTIEETKHFVEQVIYFLKKDFNYILFGDIVNLCNQLSSGATELKKSLSVSSFLGALREYRKSNVIPPNQIAPDYEDPQVRWESWTPEQRAESLLYGSAFIYRQEHEDHKAKYTIHETAEMIRKGEIKIKKTPLNTKINLFKRNHFNA